MNIAISGDQANLIKVYSAIGRDWINPRLDWIDPKTLEF
jgi:hypothetical protein